jgi:hypothetical protein
LALAASFLDDHVRFGADFVRLAHESSRFRSARCMSQIDPEQKFATLVKAVDILLALIWFKPN